jgi:hypothetical protein
MSLFLPPLVQPSTHIRGLVKILLLSMNISGQTKGREIMCIRAEVIRGEIDSSSLEGVRFVVI